MMKDRAQVRLIAGVISIGIGLLWIGQGTGLVAWPEASPMIGRGGYAWWGGALVLIGLTLIKMARGR